MTDLLIHRSTKRGRTYVRIKEDGRIIREWSFIDPVKAESWHRELLHRILDDGGVIVETSLDDVVLEGLPE